MLTIAIASLAQDTMPAGVPDMVGTFAGYGIAGLLFLMVIFRWKIQPTYVAEDAKTASDANKAQMERFHQAELLKLNEVHEASIARIMENRERERVETKTITDAIILKTQTDLDETRVLNSELTGTIIEKVVPAVTRVVGPLGELVELKRAQSHGRGQDAGN